MTKAEMLDRRSHWEGVYLNKDEPQLSWHQDDPALSLELVSKLCPQGGAVLDVGGGSSLLASKLVASRQAKVAVIDLAGAALRRAQERSGAATPDIHWETIDVVGPSWPLPNPFDVWHDRAVFHFLTDPKDRAVYVERVQESVRSGGHLVIATFALDGPEKCSGLPVQRYDADTLASAFAPGLTLVEAHKETHATPWGSEQAFVYAVLRRSGDE